MNKKYIIRNCPCYGKRFYFDDNALGTYVQCICKDNDCILKQIVEKCKLFQNNYLVNDGVQLLTTNILNSLDIQRLNNEE